MSTYTHTHARVLRAIVNHGWQINCNYSDMSQFSSTLNFPKTVFGLLTRHVTELSSYIHPRFFPVICCAASGARPSSAFPQFVLILPILTHRDFKNKKNCTIEHSCPFLFYLLKGDPIFMFGTKQFEG